MVIMAAGKALIGLVVPAQFLFFVSMRALVNNFFD
jgi:hypothetical protein